MAKGVYLLFFIASATNAKKDDKLNCPFKRAEEGWKNCFRDPNLIMNLRKNLELMNMRPDIIVKNATQNQMIEMLVCCYEYACLKECGIDVGMLFANSSILSKYLEVLMERYPSFFLEYDQREVDDILNGKATEKVEMGWKISLMHLILVAPEVLKQQYAMESITY